MNIKNKFSKFIAFFKNYVSNFLKAQLVVTLVSFPILMNWGLPFSYMSFLGNFIFSPVLTIFLVLSSLIFVTELLSIPNALLIHGLTLTTSLWEYLLSFGQKKWLICFAKPKTVLMILILALGALLVLRVVFRILSKIMLVAIVIFSFFIIFEYNRQQRWPTEQQVSFFPNSRKKMSIVQLPNKKLKIIDNGFFNRKRSPKKFINFELKPYLIKKYGTMSLEKIVLQKPSARSFRAVEELSQTFRIKTVAIAYFENLRKYGWRCYFSLKEKLVKNGTKIERFNP